MSEKKDWKKLIEEAAKTAKKPPQQIFLEAMALAQTDLENQFEKLGRKMEVKEGGGNPNVGKGVLTVSWNGVIELRLAIACSAEQVSFGMTRAGQVEEVRGGKPQSYTAAIFRNAIAWFYHQSMTGAPVGNFEPADFAE